MNENTVYNTGFNLNEWFVISVIVIFIAAIWLFPRRFSPLQTLFLLLIGIVFGLIFDHTIHVPPFSLYAIGDQQKYETFDMLTYLMYSPFGYWYIYWYERLPIGRVLTILYLLLWTGISVGFEWLAVLAGVFHYSSIYRIEYSVVIYLFLLSFQLGLYRLIFDPARWIKHRSHG